MSVVDFQRRCRAAFMFLEETYGFRPTMSGDGFVQYGCGPVTFSIKFDYKRSYELETEFAFAGQIEPSFTLGEVLLLHDAAMPHAVQATTEEALERFLHEMAQLVRDHATRLLKGERSEFDRLSEQRKRLFKQKQETQRLEDAIQGAQDAWAKKDYFTVVRLLAPFEAKLSRSKARLLTLARNRVASRA